LRIRTIFAPFALCVTLGLAVALASAERPAARADHVKSLASAPRVARDTLIVPVRGLDVGDLADNWGAARSQSRVHQGIDIMAPYGAPVLAASDGEIVRFWNSELGGVSIYQADADGDLVYYYAHLSARADNIKEGDRVAQGQVIGYVGSTGNATTPHLHFEMARVEDVRRWWRGEEMNPYPYLVSGEAPP
jgi:murein DD-endopeptidase MepM/ murein hydrolase activator NlpD